MKKMDLPDGRQTPRGASDADRLHFESFRYDLELGARRARYAAVLLACILIAVIAAFLLRR